MVDPHSSILSHVLSLEDQQLRHCSCTTLLSYPTTLGNVSTTPCATGMTESRSHTFATLVCLVWLALPVATAARPDCPPTSTDFAFRTALDADGEDRLPEWVVRL